LIASRDHLEVEKDGVEDRSSEVKVERPARDSPADLLCALDQIVEVENLLRDTNQILLDMTPCARLQPLFRHEVDMPAEDVLEIRCRSK